MEPRQQLRQWQQGLQSPQGIPMGGGSSPYPYTPSAGGGTLTASRLVSWDQLAETGPGIYVDPMLGDVFRVPPQALQFGRAPVIRREATRAARLIKISDDPFLAHEEVLALAQQLSSQVSQLSF
jgi:hypothetical protein